MRRLSNIHSAVRWLFVVAGVFLLAACSGSERPQSRAARRWDGAQVLAAFRAAGLEAERFRHGQKDSDDGLAVMMAVQVTRFKIPSRGDRPQGIVFGFADLDDLVWHINFYLQLEESSPDNATWLFWKDNVLVQISKSVDQEIALRYKSVLERLE